MLWERERERRKTFRVLPAAMTHQQAVDAMGLLPCHTVRTEEATLGPASRSYDQPTVGATTVYKYVAGQLRKKEKQNS